MSRVVQALPPGVVPARVRHRTWILPRYIYFAPSQNVLPVGAAGKTVVLLGVETLRTRDYRSASSGGRQGLACLLRYAHSQRVSIPSATRQNQQANIAGSHRSISTICSPTSSAFPVRILSSSLRVDLESARISARLNFMKGVRVQEDSGCGHVCSLSEVHQCRLSFTILSRPTALVSTRYVHGGLEELEKRTIVLNDVATTGCSMNPASKTCWKHHVLARTATNRLVLLVSAHACIHCKV